MYRSLLAAAVLGVALAGATADAAESADTVYADSSAYPLSDTRLEAWLNTRIALYKDFDDICGDTFCEGEFSNIESLRFRCSVNLATGRIGMCAWMFAASNEEIDPANGRVRISQRGFWRCRAPIVSSTTFEQFIDALQAGEPLHAPLPMTTKTLMDGLIDCL